MAINDLYEFQERERQERELERHIERTQEIAPEPAGIRCPVCNTRNWIHEFKSPVDPAGDRFVCHRGHKFNRYDGTRYGE